MAQRNAETAATASGTATSGDSEFVEKLVHINRVAKVVKGGKRFGFAALVVVGDSKGRVGFGHGKAREVPEAVRKATEGAKRRHDPHAAARRPHAASRHRRPLGRGQGDRARGARRHRHHRRRPDARRVRDARHPDVVAKSKGSSNPYNMVRADVRRVEEAGEPALGRGPPRQEGERNPRPPPRRAAAQREAASE